MAITPTVRLRLTLLYGGMFLACGAALLAINYVLVQQATDGIIFSNQNNSAVVTGEDPQGQGSSSTNRDRQGGDPAPTALSPQQASRLAREQHDAELHRLLLQSGIALAALALGSSDHCGRSPPPCGTSPRPTWTGDWPSPDPTTS
jgi:hypothetical protein